jgi:excinuclease ABC subunit C
MVVWEGGGMKKDDYKRFKIRTVPGADDFAMMAEVLRRRYGKALEDGGSLPDLIMLDGGRGQLKRGSRVLEELGLDYLPIVALAKRAEEVYHPGSLQPLVLDLASPRSRRFSGSGTRRTGSPSPTTRSSGPSGPWSPSSTRSRAWAP